jgi:hypothetical protein
VNHFLYRDVALAGGPYVFLLYVNIQMAWGCLDIYMSIHLFEIQMWFTCVFCVDVDDVDSIYML